MTRQEWLTTILCIIVGLFYECILFYATLHPRHQVSRTTIWILGGGGSAQVAFIAIRYVMAYFTLARFLGPMNNFHLRTMLFFRDKTFFPEDENGVAEVEFISEFRPSSVQKVPVFE
jgi:hypothetical protein